MTDEMTNKHENIHNNAKELSEALSRETTIGTITAFASIASIGLLAAAPIVSSGLICALIGVTGSAITAGMLKKKLRKQKELEVLQKKGSLKSKTR